MLKGILYIISSPSGGGKTSLISGLIERTSNLEVSISHTTRQPRKGEVEGKNYFFVNEENFKLLEKSNSFLEYAQVFDYYYGTAKAWIFEKLESGIDVILDIDWQGMRKVKSQVDIVSIFILPPSRDALFSRLQNRQDETRIIESRMQKASAEITHYNEYDYLIVNDNFNTALAELSAIIQAQRLKTEHQAARYEKLISTLVQA